MASHLYTQIAPSCKFILVRFVLLHNTPYSVVQKPPMKLAYFLGEEYLLTSHLKCRYINVVLKC